MTTYMRYVEPTIAVLILLLLIGAVWLGLIAPLFDFISEIEGDIDRSQLVIARYRQLEDSEPQLLNRLQKLKALVSADELLPGANPAQIDADLQAHVRKVILDSGAAPAGTRTLPHGAEGPFTRFGVEVELRATSPQISAVIQHVETDKPALFVDRLSLRVPESGDGQHASDGQPFLNISVRLTGYALLLPAQTRAK